MAAEDTLGTRIKRARERLRLTQKQLGQRVGKSVRTVNDWENDRTYPKNSIGALEEVFGHSLERPGEPDVPWQVAENADIRQVTTIWEIPDERMPRAQRVAMVELWLRKYRPERLPETGLLVPGRTG